MKRKERKSKNESIENFDYEELSPLRPSNMLPIIPNAFNNYQDAPFSSEYKPIDEEVIKNIFINYILAENSPSVFLYRNDILRVGKSRYVKSIHQKIEECTIDSANNCFELIKSSIDDSLNHNIKRIFYIANRIDECLACLRSKDLKNYKILFFEALGDLVLKDHDIVVELVKYAFNNKDQNCLRLLQKLNIFVDSFFDVVSSQLSSILASGIDIFEYLNEMISLFIDCIPAPFLYRIISSIDREIIEDFEGFSHTCSLKFVSSPSYILMYVFVSKAIDKTKMCYEFLQEFFCSLFKDYKEETIHVLESICDVLRNKKIVGSYGRSIVQSGIRAGLSPNTNVLSKQISLEIDRIINGNLHLINSNVDTLVDLMFWVGDLSIVEAHYIDRLVTRLLSLKPRILANEKLVVSKINEVHGGMVFNTVNSMLLDAEQSLYASKKFFNSHPKSIQISFNVISSSYFNRVNIDSVPSPAVISESMNDFTEFYHDLYGKRTLKWMNRLSRATLIVSGISGLRKVKCDGITAYVLLTLGNNIGKSIEEVKSQIQMEKGIFESIVLQLQSEKCSSLLHKSQKIQFSEEISNINDELVIYYNKDAEFAARHQETNPTPLVSHESSLDSAIVRIVKEHKKLQQKELLQLVQEKVSFPINETVLDKRVSRLETKHYITRENNEFKYNP